MKADIGLRLKSGTMEVDREVLLEDVKKFISTWELFIKQEKNWMIHSQIDLVVSDIEPGSLRVQDLPK